MEDAKKIWMVRIGDHIRGPYETEAVKSLILTHKISEIDEIALPCKSWTYVRDRENFKETLKNLRSASFTKSNDSSLTNGHTGTENLADFTSPGDQTEELTSANVMDTRTTPLSDFENLELEKPVLNVNEMKSSARLIENPAAKKNRSKFTLLAILIVSILGGSYFYLAKQLKYSPMALLGEDYTEKFNISWKAGNYSEALKNLKAKKSLIKKNRLKYAALLLLNGNSFDGAMTALEQVEDKRSAEWKNIKGLIKFKNSEYDSAESLFLNALEQTPSYVPALVNMGLLKRKNKDWEGARFYFESAYSSSSEEMGQEEISFYLVESWLQQIMKKDGLTQIEEVRAFLINRLTGQSTFSHELQLFDIWINTLKGSWDEKEEDVLKRFVDLDPFLTLERKRNPYFHRWGEGELSYICDGLSDSLVSEAFKKTSIGLCWTLNKQYNKTIRVLGEASDEYEASLLSFVYRVTGNDLKADELLVSAMEQTKNENFVKFFLQARFCFDKGDMKCSAEYWKKALDYNQEAYTAHTGLARAYYEVDDLKRARKYLARAEVFTNSYSPLIELQYLMSNKSE